MSDELDMLINEFESLREILLDEVTKLKHDIENLRQDIDDLKHNLADSGIRLAKKRLG